MPGQQEAREGHGRLAVHVDHLRDALARRALGHARDAEARVVHEHVHGAERLGRPRGDAVGRRRIGEVVDDRHDERAAERPALGRDRLETVGAPRRDREPRPHRRQLPRERGAEPGGGARDEDAQVAESGEDGHGRLRPAHAGLRSVPRAAAPCPRRFARRTAPG